MLTVYLAVVAATALERLAELVVSTRNARWSFARGGVESGRGHFPPMVALHTGLLVACVVEVLVADRPFTPWVGWPALALVVASQALRWWCIATLGPRWNTRVIVVPDLPLVARGPYRWMRHPNYVAVVVEGVALPLVHGAWVTAVAFTVLNAVLLLGFRIPAEARALEAARAAA
ncbi:isoprenylcysteine carboxyl methyltransferase family protein [Cellulomonas sp. APG4]|uniref:isoprenylcysteine carboxyl methyltransferase family protein n=1 Tax=Cellulomonas sp. APG4 TaxID=1538656 RepID=UPI00137AE9EF|nr:isoprenylcysteine carboxyl methyltransferase family protein [Cellulomonas sp. APG4]NCT90937.1 isoprenylcysteine carboxyl methyltransferase family protein [Cellulomonas sp. APG4]